MIISVLKSSFHVAPAVVEVTPAFAVGDMVTLPLDKVPTPVIELIVPLTHEIVNLLAFVLYLEV
jgi:hypothetical protein